jgi:hypothetical protein
MKFSNEGNAHGKPKNKHSNKVKTEVFVIHIFAKTFENTTFSCSFQMKAMLTKSRKINIPIMVKTEVFFYSQKLVEKYTFSFSFHMNFV